MVLPAQLVVEESPSPRFGQIKQARGPRQFLSPELEKAQFERALHL